MRLLSIVGALALGMGLALAQTVPEGVSIAGATCPPILPDQMEGCAVVVTPTVAGGPILLVLGTAEMLPLDDVPVDYVNWRDAWTNNPSLLDPTNPITTNQPNFFVTRHGNPYFPYYQVAQTPQAIRVAGAIERMVVLPASLSAQNRDSLLAVRNRYSGMTTAQARALGYEPVGACIDGVGQVYVNQALVDGTFDPMQPEAFTYSPDGDLLAAHYIVTGTQTTTLFGQPTTASPLVDNAQQLTVWLFQNNENGIFATRSTDSFCPRPAAPRSIPRAY